MQQPDVRPSTPAAALAELLAGNQRFVSGTRIHPHQDAEYRVGLAAQQRPFAVLFGCSDSRLAAEIIFDRGLGDLFVVRTAGHILGPEVRASIEYAVAVLHAPLVVVLGHDSCGAIAAALATLPGALSGVGDAVSGDLGAIVDRIMPSIENAHRRRITEPDQITGV
ncbi:MAG TPA: carbonic anhydrase, partial [Micromonosporaceae bacterium]